ACKTATGLPPHAYLNSVRIRQARRLLRAGVRPAEVAAEVGFTDQAHLSRHFKRVVGVPPAAYQRTAGTDEHRSEPAHTLVFHGTDDTPFRRGPGRAWR